MSFGRLKEAAYKPWAVASCSAALLNPGPCDFGGSLWLTSPDHMASGAVQAGRGTLIRTDNPREASGPLIVQGCLGCFAKPIIGSRDLIPFHRGYKS